MFNFLGFVLRGEGKHEISYKNKMRANWIKGLHLGNGIAFF